VHVDPSRTRSNMPQQAMIIEPKDQLQFKGPYTDVVETKLKLKNPTYKRMAFKVKTTAPRQYCVRPNSGFVEEGEERVITVMLQPLPSGQPNAETSRHKFLVQTAYVADGEESTIEDLFKNAGPEDLMDSKLRVMFDQNASSTNVGAETSVGSLQQKTVGETTLNASADLRRAYDQIEQLKKENSKLKKQNLEYSSASSGNLSCAGLNEEMKFAVWQVALVGLLSAILGLVLSKIIF